MAELIGIALGVQVQSLSGSDGRARRCESARWSMHGGGDVSRQDSTNSAAHFCTSASPR